MKFLPGSYSKGALLISLLALGGSCRTQMFWGVEEIPIPWPLDEETSASLAASSSIMVDNCTSTSYALTPGNAEAAISDEGPRVHKSPSRLTGPISITTGTGTTLPGAPGQQAKHRNR